MAAIPIDVENHLNIVLRPKKALKLSLSIESIVDGISKTRLFKDTENFTTKK